MALPSASSASSAFSIPLTCTVATLPPAGLYTGRLVYVTDLGGGADVVISDGSFWKYVRRGVISSIPASAGYIITPLSSPTIIKITGTIATNMAISIVNAKLYPGYEVTILVSGSILTGLGVGVSALGTTIPLTGGSWSDLHYDGTTFFKIRGGSL